MTEDDPNRPRPITPEQLEQLKAGPHAKLFEGLVAVYLPPFREMTEDERKSADEFWTRQMETTTKG